MTYTTVTAAALLVTIAVEAVRTAYTGERPPPHVESATTSLFYVTSVSV